MSFVASHLKFMDALCKAVGVDPNVTSRIVIDIQADMPPRVRVSQWLDSPMADALQRVFELTEWEE